jgi:hypothetical protein
LLANKSVINGRLLCFAKKKTGATIFIQQQSMFCHASPKPAFSNNAASNTGALCLNTVAKIVI